MRVLAIGGGGHAKAVIDAALERGGLEVIGVLDSNKSVGEVVLKTQVRTVSVVGADWNSVSLSGVEGAIICLGNNYVRKRLVEAIKQDQPQLSFPRVVHPRAVVASSAFIGEGTVVLAGCVVNPCAKVGSFCILNTLSCVEHDCTVREYAFIGPRATLSGGVEVGDTSFIGCGSTVVQGRTIGSNSLVGAGSVVYENIPSSAKAYGVPARVHGEANEQTLSRAVSHSGSF